MNIKKRVAILSGEQKTLSVIDNANQNAKLAAEMRLLGLNFSRAIGSYQGAVESSFVVDCSEDSTLQAIKALAKDFNQESILIVNDDAGRTADLFFVQTGKKIKGGEFHHVTALQARELDGWTLLNNQYFSVI